MTEYISREGAIERIQPNVKPQTVYGEGYLQAIEHATAILELMPAADVQPVIHAHWIRGEEKGFRTYNPLWYCSNCGGQIRYDTRMRQYQKTKRPVWEVNAFCRKCGARMDGGAENDT